MATPRMHFYYKTLFFLLISFFQPSLHQPLCHKVERLALMQFKESFVVEKRSSASSFSYPKVDLWESQGVDCCLWEGIWCDQNNGRVIGLDLSHSCLFGSINSSSSLFHLVHLRHLNLALNDFNYSEIPSALGNLSRLNYLNLSNSFFHGQVPSEISKLSKLAKLDLSSNFDNSSQGLLELREPDLNSLVHNLTRLESLDLSFVNINSFIPSGLANMSSLTSLFLSQCGLFGTFPMVIFQLSKLEYLRVDGNWGLSGSFPEFHSSNPLKALFVNNTGFSGEFPRSFGLLSSLEYLEVRNCNFSGFLPSSLSNLTMLHHFSLRNNSFQGSTVHLFSNFTQLSYFDLGLNLFTFSEIPTLPWATHLQVLVLSFNQIKGPFPSWLVNLTQLTQLRLDFNMLEGFLPSSISSLKNLEILNISRNYFVGTILFNTLLGLKRLNYLSLSGNSFSLSIKNITNISVRKFYELGLGSCDLREIPTFLHNQDQLSLLDLSLNNIHGLIPKWLLTTSASLWSLDLRNNSFIGFEESYDVIPSGMLLLSLSFNSLIGPLQIPPPSIFYYNVGGNKFSGEIPPQFCNLSSLHLLDLSHNNLGGSIPQCLASQSKSLLVLNLEDNNFRGLIPANWVVGNELMEIKLGQNGLHGKLPRSLVNCERLEYLDLGNNQIRDTFPSWLGVLPQLKIVILRFNGFYGGIDDQESDLLFPKLRIVDLSHNEFLGHLPVKFFTRWKAMSSLGVENATYLHADLNIEFEMKDFSGRFPVSYSMTITNKGLKMEYAKILEIFTAIDLSCNKLEGDIPEAVGNLRGIQLLNLSNNMLAGPIPPALGYLSNLEALDLSYNKLSGGIPTQLVQLNFLAVFNVSHNLLTGPIPQGKQFDTFDNSSFSENVELCGTPLSKKCGSSIGLLPPSSTFEDNKDSSFLAGFGWKVVLLGFACGFLGGAVIGTTLFNRKQEWFMKTFRVKRNRTRRKVGRR